MYQSTSSRARFLGDSRGLYASTVGSPIFSLDSVYEEEYSSEVGERSQFSRSFVSFTHPAVADEEAEDFEEEEHIIEDSEYLHDVAATPPTPSTPSFAATPRPGSAGSRETEDNESDSISEMVAAATIGDEKLELQHIGSTVGLTKAQITARQVLKERNLWRASRGEGRGPIHLEQMGMLLRSFDALVMEYGDGAVEELKGSAFWERYETLEESAARAEQLDETEKAMKELIPGAEQTLKTRLEALEKMQEEEFTAQDDAEEDDAEQPPPLPDDELYRIVPGLKARELERTYAKYKLPSVVPDERQGTDLEAEAREFATATPASKKRTMGAEEVRRQRQAERAGAPLPWQERSAGCLPSAVIHFHGPVFKSTGAHRAAQDAPSDDHLQPRVRFSALGDPIVPVGARLRRTDKDPAHKRENAPEPPLWPTRSSWARACKAAGQHRAWKGQAASKRAAFRAKYTPRELTGAPVPPPPPGSFPAPPFPGEPLPACQLRLKGLPMKCSEDDVRLFFGKAADMIQAKNKDGFKDGVKIFQTKDGWLTGEAIVKFQTKRAAMSALLAFDRKLLGDRVIHLTYFMEFIPEPRGRLMVTGLNRKTSIKDLRNFFSGWHLAPSEDGHDPELLNEEEGWPSGDAVIIFVDIPAADNALLNFDFDKQLHGKTLKVKVMMPLEYDEISESWIESSQLAESTELILDGPTNEDSFDSAQ